MTIEQEDLIIYPLNSNELSLWLNDIPTLEKQLKCTYSAFDIDRIFKDIVFSQLIMGLSEPQDNWLWYTYWFIIRKSDRRVVGTLCFKGKPNFDGEVEVGYALGKEFEHKGYMTMALTALIKQVKSLPNVKHIIAETKKDNYASQNLLKRCGFEQYKQTDCSAWFRINLVEN